MIINVSEIIFDNNKGYQPGISRGRPICKNLQNQDSEIRLEIEESRERFKVKMKIQM